MSNCRSNSRGCKWASSVNNNKGICEVFIYVTAEVLLHQRAVVKGIRPPRVDRKKFWRQSCINTPTTCSIRRRGPPPEHYYSGAGCSDELKNWSRKRISSTVVGCFSCRVMSVCIFWQFEPDFVGPFVFSSFNVAKWKVSPVSSKLRQLKEVLIYKHNNKTIIGSYAFWERIVTRLNCIFIRHHGVSWWRW